MSKIDSIEQLIRAGKIKEARELVKKQLGQSRPRETQAKLAELARRVGLPDISVKLLHRQVRGIESATPHERCEYAISLIRLGYFREGREILNDPELLPLAQTKKFSAFADIYNWDYEAAENKLLAYLELANDDYDKLVTEVNLAACQVILARDYGQTVFFLKDILGRAAEISATRLEANCFELLAELYLYHNKFTDALRVLDLASARLDETGSFDGFFIKKWKVLLELKKNAGEKSVVKKVLHFRKSAHQNGHWEIARDCDLHLGIWNRNRSVLEHLIFGTPYWAYRERVRRLAKTKIELPQKYLWRINRTEKPKLVYDLESKDLSEQNLLIIRALASDFYRPIRLSTIFEKTFSDQYYDPFSTPNRVHQAIWRLRKELAEKSIPLIVIEKDGYGLHAEESFGILVSNKYSCPRKDLQYLKQKLAGKEFTSSQAAKIMEVSARKAQSLLCEAVADGSITRNGLGRATRYRIK